MGSVLHTARLDLVLLEPVDARALAAGINRNGHPWAAGYPLGIDLLRAELTLAAAAQDARSARSAPIRSSAAPTAT